MRRHPSRALVLSLLSLAAATSTRRAYAQTPGAAPPSAAGTAAPTAPDVSAPAPASQPEPASASPKAAGAAAAEVTNAPVPRPAPPLAPYPGDPPPAPVAQPKPLPPRVAPALPEDAAPAPAAAALPSLAAWLGINTLWIPSDGFDPYSENDALTLFDVGAALSLAGDAALDVAAVATWGVASSEADYRSQAAELTVMRMSAGPELRGLILDRVYWHGRLSPTATRLAAELDETSSRASFADTRWAFGIDAAVGLDVRFVEARTELPQALGFFVRAEAGYAWTQNVELELEPQGGDAPVRTEPITLPELALRGPILRASVGAGF